MSKSTLVIALVIVVLLVISGVWLFSDNQLGTAQNSPSISPSPSVQTVKLSDKTGVGSYLTDANGMALYYFTQDTRGTATSTPRSSCAGQCLAIWPAFYSNRIIVASPLDKSNFSEIIREDGVKTLVYKGWPLYHYTDDKNPGDTNGDKVNGVWFAAKP